MGIPSYFSYIVKNHNEIFKKVKYFKKIDNLYFDSNSIIYDCLRETEEKYKETNKTINNISLILYEKVCKRIEYYIKEIKPQNVVFITFDGVAPVAKLEQQRQRRHKSKFIQLIENEIKKKSVELFDKTLITPGTEFMKQLDYYVKRYFSNSNLCKKIIISGTFDVGEGEHKIFKFIRDNPTYHKQTTTFVYGLDADLIMLSLNHLSVSNNIYLFRENPNYNKDLNTIFDKDELCVLQIYKLSYFIIQHMINDKTDTNSKQLNKKYFKYKIYDYILISFLLGNDFMPHFPSLNIRTSGIDILLNTYKNIIGESDYLCDGEKINWRKLRLFLQELANNELNNLKEEYKNMNKQKKRYIKSNTMKDKLDKFNLLPTKNRKIEHYINPYQDKWQERYYSTLFHFEEDRENIKTVCLNYLEGLEWCLNYYTKGCINYRWCYHYHYPPLLNDLIQYIPVFDTIMIEENYSVVSPLTQLTYVIPYECYSILPDKLRYVIENDNEFELQNVEKYNYIWAFCKYFWECHVELPYMNIQKIEKLVKKYENENENENENKNE